MIAINCNHLRSNVQRVATQNFVIPESYRDAFVVQNLLHIPGNFLPRYVSNGCIRYQGYSYLIVYHKCTALEARNSEVVKLSYRKPAKEYSIPGYVLVEIL